MLRGKVKILYNLLLLLLLKLRLLLEKSGSLRSHSLRKWGLTILGTGASAPCSWTWQLPRPCPQWFYSHRFFGVPSWAQAGWPVPSTPALEACPTGRFAQNPLSVLVPSFHPSQAFPSRTTGRGGRPCSNASTWWHYCSRNATIISSILSPSTLCGSKKALGGPRTYQALQEAWLYWSLAGRGYSLKWLNGHSGLHHNGFAV